MMNASTFSRNIIQRNAIKVWSTVCRERMASTFCRSGYFIRHCTPISDPFHSASSFTTVHSNYLLSSSSSYIHGASPTVYRNVMTLVTVSTMLLALGCSVESTQTPSTPSRTTITSKRSLRMKLEQ